MLLHDAIRKVLSEANRGLSSKEIAVLVNNKNLYSRRDNLSVPASQISARINKYPKLFERVGTKIYLK